MEGVKFFLEYVFLYFLFGLNTNDEDLKQTLKTILFDKVFPLGIDEIRSNFNINILNEKP